jgi:hypothetical protein
MVSKEQARKIALRKEYEKKKKNAEHAGQIINFFVYKFFLIKADVTNPVTGSKGLLQGQQSSAVTATGTATTPSSASSTNLQIDQPGILCYISISFLNIFFNSRYANQFECRECRTKCASKFPLLSFFQTGLQLFVLICAHEFELEYFWWLHWCKFFSISKLFIYI